MSAANVSSFPRVSAHCLNTKWTTYVTAVCAVDRSPQGLFSLSLSLSIWRRENKTRPRRGRGDVCRAIRVIARSTRFDRFSASSSISSVLSLSFSLSLRTPRGATFEEDPRTNGIRPVQGRRDHYSLSLSLLLLDRRQRFCGLKPGKSCIHERTITGAALRFASLPRFPSFSSSISLHLNFALLSEAAVYRAKAGR